MRRVALLIFLVTACKKTEEPPPAAADPAWEKDLTAFRMKRAKQIGGPDGWMTLIARVILKQGPNTIGSDLKSDVLLPADRSPPLLGRVVLEGHALTFTAAEGADVKIAGAKVETAPLADDSKGKPTVVEAGSLRLHVLSRGDLFVMRVKDRDHPSRAGFKGLEWFLAKPVWRVRAKLEPSPPGTTIPILNVLNQTEQQPTPGHLKFSVGGAEYRLAALTEGDDPGFFILFKDQTAGQGTYPSGRFINTPAPAADGTVELDFNRAYSPPCAFTSFATCPLPPRENHLAMKIEAGEKFSGQH